MFALALLLAQPVVCPPDVGQIKWSGFSYTYTAGGETSTIEGTLWDRDRSGKPSKGDLFRIDASERWFVLGGGLVPSFAARFKQISGELTATCESRFEVEGVPTLQSPAGLAELSDGGAAQKADPVTRLQGLMRGWAEEICGKKQHYEEAQLADELVRRAASERGFKNSTLRREAHAVAKEFGLKCAHLAVPQMTFD
jgi:hypothetical protein